jgi:hypothetical protein
MEYYKGYKIIELGEMFFKLDKYEDMTLEEFKVWMREVVNIPEEEWEDPDLMFGLWTFTSTFNIYNLEIFEYLIQLGKDCFDDALYALDHLEYLYKSKYDEKFYGKWVTEKKYYEDKKNDISYFEKKINICKKYMGEERFNDAVEFQKIMDDGF